MWDDETRPRAPATERVPGRTWAAAALRLRRCALMRKIVGGGARCEGVSTLTRHCCCASTGTAVGISCRVCCFVCVPRTVLVGYEVGGSTLLGSRRMHSVFVQVFLLVFHFPLLLDVDAYNNDLPHGMSLVFACATVGSWSVVWGITYLYFASLPDAPFLAKQMGITNILTRHPNCK